MSAKEVCSVTVCCRCSAGSYTPRLCPLCYASLSSPSPSRSNVFSLYTPPTYPSQKIAKKTDTSEFKGKLKKLTTFNTVEGFWRAYLYLKRPSALEGNVNLYLFREGPSVCPMWEAFPRGGCWILKVKKKTTGPSVLGKMWQDIVLALIGEQFDEPDVVGISVCIRKAEDLISVWNSDNRNEEIRFRIGEKMKEVLDLEPSTVIEYKAHAESMQDLSTFRNTKAYVFAAAAGSPTNGSPEH